MTAVVEAEHLPRVERTIEPDSTHRTNVIAASSPTSATVPGTHEMSGLAAQAEQASVTSLVAQGLEDRPYERSAGVGMVVSPGTSGRLPERLETSLVVVRSEKRCAGGTG